MFKQTRRSFAAILGTGPFRTGRVSPFPSLASFQPKELIHLLALGWLSSVSASFSTDATALSLTADPWHAVRPFPCIPSMRVSLFRCICGEKTLFAVSSTPAHLLHQLLHRLRSKEAEISFNYVSFPMADKIRWGLCPGARRHQYKQFLKEEEKYFYELKTTSNYILKLSIGIKKEKNPNMNFSIEIQNSWHCSWCGNGKLELPKLTCNLENFVLWKRS